MKTVRTSRAFKKCITPTRSRTIIPFDDKTDFIHFFWTTGKRKFYGILFHYAQGLHHVCTLPVYLLVLEFLLITEKANIFESLHQHTMFLEQPENVRTLHTSFGLYEWADDTCRSVLQIGPLHEFTAHHHDLVLLRVRHLIGLRESMNLNPDHIEPKVCCC